MSYHSDPHASIVLVTDELVRRGYSRQTNMLENGQFIVELISLSGRRWITSAGRVSYPLNNGYISRLARDKTLAGMYVRHSGFPTPYTCTLAPQQDMQLGEFEEMVHKYGNLVVKPEASSMSRGLTLNVNSYDKLLDAIAAAREATDCRQNIIVQQQIDGEEIRFTVIEGEVVAALLRRTARVIGDGVRTISQLIEDENNQRAAIQNSMMTYPLLTSTNIDIDERLLISKQIPAGGEVVELNRSTMLGGGASIYNVLEDVHPSYLSALQDIIKVMGSGFIVADVIMQDYTTPMTGENMFFNEYNDAPALKLYYSCRDGNNYDIVQAVADAIEKRMA